MYLRLNNGENELTLASVVKEIATRWRSSSPKINKRASERASREDNMKRIKIYVEGGVVQDVIFEGLIKDEEMTYEVIDYDEIDVRENEKNKQAEIYETK